jgi:hypothetical protein
MRSPEVTSINEIMRIQKQIEDHALGLLGEIHEIQDLIKDEKLKEALEELESRFFMYNPLRNLLDDLFSLYNLETELRKLEVTKQLPGDAARLWRVLDSKNKETENKEEAFGRWIVRELASEGEFSEMIKAAVEEVENHYKPLKTNQVKEFAKKIEDHLMALITLARDGKNVLKTEKRLIRA